MTKRAHGDGGIDQRGENSWRLRYREGGKRYTKTFHGTEWEARKELARLTTAVNSGQHVAPAKIKLADWIGQWIEAGAPGRRKKRVGHRTLERYAQLLRCHVVPVLGARPLQQVKPTEIDKLYAEIEQRRSARAAHYVHVVLGACLGTAARKGLLVSNPIDKADAPSPGEADHGTVLDELELTALVQGFKGTVLYPMVAVAAFTGAPEERNFGVAVGRPIDREQDVDDRQGARRHQGAWPRHQSPQDNARVSNHRDR